MRRLAAVASRVSRALGGRRGGTAFALYLIAAFAFIGARVVEHPERRMVGGLFTDPQIFIWSFAWWPHAILHGQNPFFTHAIWEPDGFNLTWATSVPGLAIAFAPVTLLFGPILAYNVASILMPALAAWTAFLLCRHLTGKVWPSLAGGYLFGFSTYVLSAELTHIFSAAVFLLPVAALLAVRFVQGELGRRGFALRMGLVLAGQMLLSTEILFTLTLAIATSLVLGFALVPPRRRRIAQSLLPLAGAYALAALLTLPFVYYAASGTGSRPPSGAEAFSGDLLNLVVPTEASLGGWWGRHVATAFPANDAERGTYLGVPLLAIVCLFAWRWRRSAAGRFLVVGFALAVLCSLGAWLTVDGHRAVTLPWMHLAERPFFRNVMPVQSDGLRRARRVGDDRALGRVHGAAALAADRPSRTRGRRDPAEPGVGRMGANARGAAPLHDEPLPGLSRPQGERAAPALRDPWRLDDLAGEIRVLVRECRRLHLSLPARGLHHGRGDGTHRDRGHSARRLDRRHTGARTPEARHVDRPRCERGFALGAGAAPVRASAGRRRRADLPAPRCASASRGLRRGRESRQLTLAANDGHALERSE